MRTGIRAALCAAVTAAVTAAGAAPALAADGQADLSLDVAVAPATIADGETTTMTLTATNADADETVTATVGTSFPLDLTMGTATGAGSFNTLTAQWLVTVPPGETRSIDLPLTATASGTKALKAEVVTHDVEGSPSDIDPDSTAANWGFTGAPSEDDEDEATLIVNALPTPVDVSFGFASTSKAENGGGQIVVLNTPGAGTGTFKVAASGTATPNVDYDAAFTADTFDQDNSGFTVAITDDAVDEPDETIVLTLTDPTGDVQFAAPQVMTITITDDDPPAAGTVRLGAGSFMVTEGQSITIPATGATASGTGGVELATIPGTATGADYGEQVAGLFMDTATRTVDTIISTTDDSAVEGDETFQVKLQNPSGALAVGDPGTATVTIKDNDGGAPPAGAVPLAAPPTPLPASDQVQRVLASFQRGSRFLAPQCKSRGYCDPQDVREYFRSIDLNADITIDTTSSARDAIEPSKVVVGEVVTSDPEEQRVTYTPGPGATPYKVRLKVFDPKIPEREQRCRSTQKISPGRDTTLGRYLVGKTLAELKAELLLFECYRRSGSDELDVKYAIETTVARGSRYAEVTSVTDKVLDKGQGKRLLVKMRVPPAELPLVVGQAPTSPGLGLAAADGTLTTDPDTPVGLTVSVRLPGGGAAAPRGTEVTLRDPDGQLVDRALTDAAGEATLRGRVREVGTYELYASFADGDGDAIAGSVQLGARKRTGNVTDLLGVARKIGKGTSTTVKSSAAAAPGARRAQALIPCTNSIPRKAGYVGEVQGYAERFHCAVVRNLDPSSADPGPLVVFAQRFPDASTQRLIRAAAKLGNLMTGDLEAAAKEGLVVSYAASGNTDGKLVPAPIAARTVTTAATDGQQLLGLAAAVTDISSGILAFRDVREDVTLFSDGRVTVDGVVSTISPQRQVTNATGLTLANLNVIPAEAALGRLAASGIVASGGGNVVASGGGNVVAAGGGNIVASGGGNIVASGGGNVIAAGGGNIIAAGGGNVVASGGGNVVASGGGNIVAAGGGNIVASGGGNVVAAGGGNLLAAPAIGNAFAAVAQGSGIVASGGGNVVASGGGNLLTGRF